MDLESRVLRNSQTAYRNLDGEGLVMNPTDSTLHSLNDVGSAIWEFVAEERSVGEIVDMVVERFDCTRETAEADVLAFLRQLQERRLVKGS